MPATQCIALGCTSDRCHELEAGLDLRLCTKHLKALRRMCKGKHQHPYAKVAAREAERLKSTSNRWNRTPHAYECGLSGHWHAGHELNDGPGAGDHPQAREAAYAVRLTLKPDQLNHLLAAWQWGRAARPTTRENRDNRRTRTR